MSIVVNKTRLPVTEWQTASGSVVSISDARKRYAKSLSVALDPIQDLHGYANPWVGGAGKNKFNQSDSNSLAVDVSAYALNDAKALAQLNTLQAGTYTLTWKAKIIQISPTATDTSRGRYGLYFRATNNGSDLNVNGQIDVSNPAVGQILTKSVSFTLTADYVGKFQYFWIYCGRPFYEGSDTCNFYEVQIESGSTATAYEPYENICPISGRSSVSVYDDPKYGGKIWWNQLTQIPSSDKTDTKYGVTITDNRNGSYTLNGTATQGFNFRIPDVNYENGHVYFIHSHTDVCITNDMGYNTNKGSKLQVANASRLVLFSFYVSAGSVFDNVTVFPFVCDLTQMFGAGNEPTLEQFRALFPKDYYEYNAGMETLVSAVNGDPYWNVSVSLGQTVYGCNVDLVSGVMTATKKSVTFIGDNSYSWYTYDPDNYDSFCFAVDLPDKSKKKLTSICDKYKNVDVSWGAGGNSKYCVFSDHASLARLYFRPPYSGFGETVADWKTWLSNNPLQVCYELATPQTIQLSTNQIEMLMRNNTVWSDAGQVTLEYAKIRS